MPRVPKGQGITLEEGDFGFTFVIRHDDGRDLLIQTDWDYPGTASTFGWVPKKRRGCDHPGTDGMIDCRVCGKTATEFISEAQDYLSSHIGKRVEDPGYFEYAENPRLARRKKAAKKKSSIKRIAKRNEKATYIIGIERHPRISGYGGFDAWQLDLESAAFDKFVRELDELVHKFGGGWTGSE